MCINRKHILYTRYYAKEQKTAQSPCAETHGLQGQTMRNDLSRDSEGNISNATETT